MVPSTAVWLVGLSGSGKSSVGPVLAGLLGCEFVDLDRLIEARAGRTVAEIFRDEGESGFRNREARAAAELVGRTGIVVATGGGWMAREDIPRAWRGCVRVWLRVAPTTASVRLESTASDRPLLAGSDAAAALASQLAARGAAYAEAEIAVDTDGLEPVEVAMSVMERLYRADGT